MTVLPSDVFFPVRRAAAVHSTAEALFGKAVEHAGMSDWRFRLEQLPAEGRTRELWGEETPFGAAAPSTGSVSGLSFDGEVVVVSYAPHLAEDAEAFVAAVAFELARALVLLTPGGEERADLAADGGAFLEVAVSFIGFGVFAANSVFRVDGFQGVHTQGWNSHALGVLSEIEACYSLAIYLALNDESFDVVRPYLRTNPRAYTRAALKSLQRDGSAALAELRRIIGSG